MEILSPIKPEEAARIIAACCDTLVKIDVAVITPSMIRILPNGISVGNIDHVQAVAYSAPELIADALQKSGSVGGNSTRPTLFVRAQRQCSLVFSVGCILWEMISGRRLFEAETDYETMLLTQTGVVPILGNELADLESIVKKAVAKQAEDRYHSLSELRDALIEYLGPGQQESP